jgi:hypothetical protein
VSRYTYIACLVNLPTNCPFNAHALASRFTFSRRCDYSCLCVYENFSVIPAVLACSYRHRSHPLHFFTTHEKHKSHEFFSGAILASYFSLMNTEDTDPLSLGQEFPTFRRSLSLHLQGPTVQDFLPSYSLFYSYCHPFILFSESTNNLIKFRYILKTTTSPLPVRSFHKALGLSIHSITYITYYIKLYYCNVMKSLTFQEAAIFLMENN